MAETKTKDDDTQTPSEPGGQTVDKAEDAKPDPAKAKKSTKKTTTGSGKSKETHKVDVSDNEDTRNVASENFNAQVSSQFGARLVEVQPRGWVGPAPLTITEDRLDELISVLQAFKK
jgi:hypothetical protein